MEIKVMLESMIGQEASVNQSPTLRAKLIVVYGKYCLWEVTPNHYGDKGNEDIGARFMLPLSYSDNCFHGI